MPLGLIEIADYWQPLLAFLRHAVNERFFRASTSRRCSSSGRRRRADRLVAHRNHAQDTWLDRDQGA